MTVTLRSEKGSELSFAEMDANFTEVRNIEFAFFVTEGAASGETVWSYVLTRGVTFPANFDASQASLNAAVMVDCVFSIRLDGDEAGTLSFVGGVATFDLAASLDASAGNTLSLVSTDDYEFTSLSVTLRATRN